jgi:hypothetical protein
MAILSTYISLLILQPYPISSRQTLVTLKGSSLFLGWNVLQPCSPPSRNHCQTLFSLNIVLDRVSLEYPISTPVKFPLCKDMVLNSASFNLALGSVESPQDEG